MGTSLCKPPCWITIWNTVVEMDISGTYVIRHRWRRKELADVHVLWRQMLSCFCTFRLKIWRIIPLFVCFFHLRRGPLPQRSINAKDDATGRSSFSSLQASCLKLKSELQHTKTCINTVIYSWYCCLLSVDYIHNNNSWL